MSGSSPKVAGISEHTLNAEMLMCISTCACVFTKIGFERQQLYRAELHYNDFYICTHGLSFIKGHFLWKSSWISDVKKQFFSRLRAV